MAPSHKVRRVVRVWWGRLFQKAADWPVQTGSGAELTCNLSSLCTHKVPGILMRPLCQLASKHKALVLERLLAPASLCPLHPQRHHAAVRVWSSGKRWLPQRVFPLDFPSTHITSAAMLTVWCASSSLTCSMLSVLSCHGRDEGVSAETATCCSKQQGAAALLTALLLAAIYTW